jgi:hypothetical protein
VGAAFMSLRPAQALVAEGSKFSLRTFFESSSGASGASGGGSNASPLHSSVDAMSEGLPTLNAHMQPSSQMMMMAPPLEPEHPPSPTSLHPLAAAAPCAPRRRRRPARASSPSTG